jgi:phosphoadenosine phosphosulfate reductase
MGSNHKVRVDEYSDALTGKSAEEILSWAADTFPRGKVAFATSLGLEDQIITDMVARTAPEVPVFTLDTGRLFQETYDLIEETARKYGLEIEVLFPDRSEIELMVKEHGPNLFYYSVENRKLCCRLRKVHPLRRRLSELDAWICGLRREQAVTRTDIRPVEYDEANGLVKINPLVDWTEDRMHAYIREHQVPYNRLHDQAYPSIGCRPCTRAVEEGEDVRAGRWWWENPESRECGLHPREK